LDSNIKHITLLADGHDSRVDWKNNKEVCQYREENALYSFKFKKNGLRVQDVSTPYSRFHLYTSKALPCKDNVDGNMLKSIPFTKIIHKNDVLHLDGGYTLFLNDYVEEIQKNGSNLNLSNFSVPIRKSRSVDLTEDEVNYISESGGFRSSKETDFADLASTFKRFTPKSSIQVGDLEVYSSQFAMCSLLMNFKRCLKVFSTHLECPDHIKYWMKEGFDFPEEEKEWNLTIALKNEMERKMKN